MMQLNLVPGSTTDMTVEAGDYEIVITLEALEAVAAAAVNVSAKIKTKGWVNLPLEITPPPF